MSRSEKFVPLRCPGCGAQVNVPMIRDTAKCAMCGVEWKWKDLPKRMTMGRRGTADLTGLSFVTLSKKSHRAIDTRRRES